MDHVIPAKAGIQRRMSMRRMSHSARRRGPLDPRFRGDDAIILFVLIFVFLLASLVPSHALAADQTSLSPAFCQALVKHVPDADVTYQPGIDVHGKPVAPADLPDSVAFKLQNPINIPLTASLLKVLNLPATAFPFNTMKRDDINLGTLTVDGDRVLYNGQPLTSEQQDKLAVLCMKPNNGTNRPAPTDITRQEPSQK